jgi:ATP-dependent Clp protease ATP-binding subunit ClpC
MSNVIESLELLQVLTEAEDIARSVSQKLTSAHQLLAFFTVPNRAEILLRERGIDEDRILEAMTAPPREPEGVSRDLRDRAREVAAGVGATEVDCLHLLIAMSRVRSAAAHQLLGACGLQLATLRNVALSYFTARMPRRLKEVQPVKVTQAPPQAAARTARAAPARGYPEPGHPEPTRTQPGHEPSAREARPAEPAAAPAPATRDAPGPAVAEPARATPRPAAKPLSAHALDPQEFPWLTSLGRNLTELAAQGKLDPLVGRAREVEEVIDILGKRRTNNPLLLGEPGVGKTALVEGIAQKLLSGPQTRGRVVVELDMATVVAGTQLRGAFSEKLLGIKEEVRRAQGRVVVFIDELHTLMGAGATGEGPQDAANELKAALARGEFPCIGATTQDEYQLHIQKDPALERRFTPVVVREPSVAEATQILQGLAPRYERHHGVRYEPAALEAAAALTAKYVTDRNLPDKAIAALDLAGSRARRQGAQTVGARDLARVVAQMAGLPESRLAGSDEERILGIERTLRARVVGHEAAVVQVAAVLKRNYAGFASRRPMGSFLFLGPTGVGKTELGKALAEALYGTRDALVQLDMSECAEGTGVARLIGSAPGYVGHGEGGQLTEAVRRRPASVVILDEIEKAHRDVLMLLLQVLEEGRLTDGRGRQVDFAGTVVILTSNLGAEAASRAPAALGFGAAAKAQPAGARALEAARAALPPELWNRLDERLVFEPLSRPDLLRIARLLLAESAARLAEERRIRFTVSDAAVEWLVGEAGHDPALGARPLRGAIQRLLEAPLAERILGGGIAAGGSVAVDVADGKLTFA